MAEDLEARPNDVVEVEVSSDEEHKIFQLPRCLFIRSGSTFSHLFAHPSVQAVRVKDVPVEDFCIFVGWLMTEYWRDGVIMLSPTDIAAWSDTRNFCIPWASNMGDPIVCEVTEDDQVWMIAEAAIEMYIFAKIYDVPRLSHDAIDRLIWCQNTAHDSFVAKCFVSKTAIERVYEHTKPGCFLRDWSVLGFRHFFDIDATDMLTLASTVFG